MSHTNPSSETIGVPVNIMKPKTKELSCERWIFKNASCLVKGSGEYEYGFNGSQLG